MTNHIYEGYPLDYNGAKHLLTPSDVVDIVML